MILAVGNSVYDCFISVHDKQSINQMQNFSIIHPSRYNTKQLDTGT